MDNYLPKHLAKAPHLSAFEQLIDERFSAIDIAPCMMYMVDTCSPSALPFLADQFEISELRDYQLATTDDVRRDLIKKAIQVRSYMGTVYMVKQAMTAIGYDPSWLVERCNEGIDPVNGWACFRIAISGTFTPITGIPGLDLQDLIIQYKNVRSLYLGIDYSIDAFTDSFPAGTETVKMSVNFDPFVDPFNCEGFKYDGAHKYDGSMKYKPGVEDFQCHTIP